MMPESAGPGGQDAVPLEEGRSDVVVSDAVRFGLLVVEMPDGGPRGGRIPVPGGRGKVPCLREFRDLPREEPVDDGLVGKEIGFSLCSQQSNQ